MTVDSTGVKNRVQGADFRVEEKGTIDGKEKERNEHEFWMKKVIRKTNEIFFDN